jgi:hypothetical protein
MGNALGRLVVLFLCLSLWPVAAVAAAAPRFTGTFVQLLAEHEQWGVDRWRALFASLRAIGVDEAVVQWSVADRSPLYPSRYFTDAPHVALPAVLEAARAEGLRLVLGLAHDSQYWTRIARDPKLVRIYFRRLLLDSLAAARELAGLAQGNPVFAGFYIPQEIDDRNWLDPAAAEVLGEYLTELTKGLRLIAPEAPVSVSGFSNAFADPVLLREFWARLLSRSGIDRVLFQDGIGVAKLRLEYAGPFLEAVSLAARDAGRVFTPVVETFTQIDGEPINDKPFRAEPAPLARILRQLALAGRYPHTGVMAFSLPEYCSPYGLPGAAALYAAYKNDTSR